MILSQCGKKREEQEEADKSISSIEQAQGSLRVSDSLLDQGDSGNPMTVVADGTIAIYCMKWRYLVSTVSQCSTKLGIENTVHQVQIKLYTLTILHALPR